MTISKQDAEATKRFLIFNGIIGFASEIGAIRLIQNDEAEKWTNRIYKDLKHWKHKDEE